MEGSDKGKGDRIGCWRLRQLRSRGMAKYFLGVEKPGYCSVEGLQEAGIALISAPTKTQEEARLQR